MVIGDQVAIGEFALQKKIKVFDFTIFSKVKSEKWKEAHAHTRYDFITQLENEISKPILPFEKQRAYIATQIVAEYLREYFECDAVIFRSSMHKGDEADNYQGFTKFQPRIHQDGVWPRSSMLHGTCRS